MNKLHKNPGLWEVFLLPEDNNLSAFYRGPVKNARWYNLHITEKEWNTVHYLVDHWATQEPESHYFRGFNPTTDILDICVPIYSAMYIPLMQRYRTYRVSPLNQEIWDCSVPQYIPFFWKFEDQEGIPSWIHTKKSGNISSRILILATRDGNIAVSLLKREVIPISRNSQKIIKCLTISL